MYAELTDEMVEYVAESLKAFATDSRSELLDARAVGV
jgi:hypothetical protein